MCETYCGKDCMVKQMSGENEQQNEQTEEKTEIAQSVPFLGEWLSYLFWLVIFKGLAIFLTLETLAELWFPALYVPGWILSVLCTVARCLVLLKLGSENHRYRLSGICGFVIAFFNAVFALIPEASILITDLIVAVIFMMGEYYEYTGHAEVLQQVDVVQSKKWRKLWKWYIGMYAAWMGSILLIVLLMFLLHGPGRLLTVLSLNIVIGVFVLVIFKVVYVVCLHRSAKIFLEYFNNQFYDGIR